MQLVLKHMSSFLTGFLGHRCTFLQRPCYWSRHVRDYVFQILFSDIEAIEFAVNVSFVDWGAYNVAGRLNSVRTVPACDLLFFNYTTSAFTKELSSYDSIL